MIDGRKWFTSNGSIADFLIVMAVTNPDARPSQRASMFIVPIDTPGVEIVRDVPTMEHPWEPFGGYGGHSEVVYDDVRVPAEALLGGEGEGFILAQHRLGPGRIHHCMRWLGVARRAFDMMCERATYRYAHGSLLAEKQTVQNWIADSAAEMQAARLMTLHAAWVMDTQGASAARTEVAMIKFFGAQGAPRRRRPGAAGARLARLLDRPAARADVPLRARRAHLRRPRRGPPPVGRAPRARAATSRPPTGSRASTCRPAASRRASASPTCSSWSPRTTSRECPLGGRSAVAEPCAGGDGVRRLDDLHRPDDRRDRDPEDPDASCRSLAPGRSGSSTATCSRCRRCSPSGGGSATCSAAAHGGDRGARIRRSPPPSAG